MPDDTIREVIDFYTATSEETRLEKGLPQLEFERSKELLRRFLSAPPAVIVDIGGPAWLVPDFEERWSNPVSRERILEVVRLLEREGSIVGASAHLLAIGWKRDRA